MRHFTILLTFICFWGHAQNYEDSVRSMRVQHLAELTDPESGILSTEEIAHFQGLNFFEIDTNYIITARFVKDKGKKFKMPTTTDRAPVYRRYGYVLFTIHGKEVKLTVYQNLELQKQKEMKDYLFLPFRDATSGNESYGGGRYLDLYIPKEATISLDFNLCYNPYCAYSAKFSCPIPPEENTLLVPIRAGEKTPIGH